jgi:hypothetical protein
MKIDNNNYNSHTIHFSISASRLVSEANFGRRRFSGSLGSIIKYICHVQESEIQLHKDRFSASRLNAQCGCLSRLGLPR